MISLKVRKLWSGQSHWWGPKFRIYLGHDDGKNVVIKVAKTFEDGDLLYRRSQLVQRFTSIHCSGSSNAGRIRSNRRSLWLAVCKFNLFFLEPTQQDRRINVLEVIDVDFNKLIPLSKLRSQTEIDARSSVWILGRFLKIYNFYELLAASGDNPIVQYANFSPGDYLVGPERHRLIYYNHSGATADVIANTYVMTIAKVYVGMDGSRGWSCWAEVLSIA